MVAKQPQREGKILLVDDDPVFVEAMTAVLENDGMINEHHGVGLKLSSARCQDTRALAA